MTKVTELAEIDALADSDVLYVFDVSDATTPDKKVPASKLRPTGARITNYLRFSGVVTLPNIASGAEATIEITVAGAALGDHAIFNTEDALPADLGVTSIRISAADTLSVRVRNFGTSAFATTNINAVALVARSAA